MDGPESYIIYSVDSMMMIVVHAIVAHGLDGFECGGFQDIIYKRCMKGNLGQGFGIIFANYKTFRSRI